MVEGYFEDEAAEEIAVGRDEVNYAKNTANTIELKSGVASLVEQYFGSLYVNYKATKNTLIRQARDLLVCEYNGSLQKFEMEFCRPANKLLQFIKFNIYQKMIDIQYRSEDRIMKPLAER
ncbi:hypothetical protein QE152_g24264 [Popillia japonica]|uniref:Uncharacterized protein n=1 Tax=Popillia japonica TaxID=7064 RepID=A0AAW1KFS2_POPJA